MYIHMYVERGRERCMHMYKNIYIYIYILHASFRIRRGACGEASAAARDASAATPDGGPGPCYRTQYD